MNTGVIGRLAPSPTGFLHLGNAWSFLFAWLWARHKYGRIVLRMEDIDPIRSRPEFAQAIIEDLRWLGLTWDTDIMVQSTRHYAYIQALEILQQQGNSYPCYCTRKELRDLAGAPHVHDTGAPYRGTCRHLTVTECAEKEKQGRRATVRLRCPQDGTGHISFIDNVYGLQKHTLMQCGGDFALRRSDGVFAYQLAVVVDDAAQDVSHIVRGRDILVSTPRQLYLQHLLQLPKPKYAHVPLLLDAQGERLAKRHSSLSLQSLRAANVKPQRIIGLLALLSGLRDYMQDITPFELVPQFHFPTAWGIQGKDVVLTDAHLSLLTV